MIHLRDVSKSYSRAEQTVLACAVDRLDVEAGEQVALVGRSGSGKTTLLHILAGILRADAGDVTVVGERLDQLGEAARDRHRGRHIGMVYQTFNLLQPFTALENVLMGALFGRGAAGDARNRAEALLREVGLADRMHHRPAELSVGQVQRGGISAILVLSAGIHAAPSTPSASVTRRRSSTPPSGRGAPRAGPSCAASARRC